MIGILVAGRWWTELVDCSRGVAGWVGWWCRGCAGPGAVDGWGLEGERIKVKFRGAVYLKPGLNHAGEFDKDPGCLGCSVFLS